MTDSLRDRIAAALKADVEQQVYTLLLREEDHPYSVLIDGTVDLLEVADAVIAELAVGTIDCGGCRGLGGHSPRCHTQPGYQFRRAAKVGNDR